MGDRGNCKFFSPNYFDKSKCQNCFKPKDQHTAAELTAGGDGSAPGKTPLRAAVAPKKLLKESILWKASVGRENTPPAADNWVQRWFALYSNGELQEYAIDDGQVNKESIMTSMMLQDFIRMLNGKEEINEQLCFGIKTLRDTYYFKTNTKVDYENWWKEVSSFVASPLKRTTTYDGPGTKYLGGQRAHGESASVGGASNTKSNLGVLQRANLCKQLSVPISTISPSRSSRSSSTASLHSELEDPQMEGLRKQVSKLEEENSKLTKAEKQRRELELEVNYWKEYVTNAGLMKQSGGSSDTVSELGESRRQLIQLQDELNQTQKKLKTNTGKLLIKNKELTDYKEKLREANSITAVYKAKIDQLTKEKADVLPPGEHVVMWNERDFESPALETTSVSSDAQHLEDKFLLLKEKLKRIEKELQMKSRELEKANDSRSKVAKYTRSLLQELETRLRDNQQKLNECQEKLKNSNVELSMERERRMKLEESPRRRMSNIVPTPKPFQAESYTNNSGAVPQSTSAMDLSDLGDVDTKYADYYRSRFKEAEASLLEKDKKLHQAEEKIKEIQESMKNNSDTYKVIDEMQTKLSAATHKLSDRQLQIHELEREVDRLKKFEKTYGKKRQQCGALEDIVKDLESQNSELRKSMHSVKQELEIVKIREVVLKEQLQTFLDDSDDEDYDAEAKLCKSVELKKKIECMVDLESRCKKLTSDNEVLVKKNTEYETRLRHLNMANFKNLESSKDMLSEHKSDNTEKKIKELERSLSAEEEKYCNQLSMLKEKHMNEMSALENNSKQEMAQAREELAKAREEIDKLSSNKSEMEIKIEELSAKVFTYEKNSLMKSSSNSGGVKQQRGTERLEEIDVGDNKYREEKMNIMEGITGTVSDKSSEKSDIGKTEPLVSSPSKGSVDGKDRDSGIVITQEIKSVIDAAKQQKNNIDSFTFDGDDVLSLPHDSVSEIDIIDKYKTMCGKFQVKMRELSDKYIVSEEKCIQLAESLEQLTGDASKSTEEKYAQEYETLLGRIDELESQIMESQELLQSKADELEKERKNVIHLVEVTSAYIKELEGSLEESKAKMSELQKSMESTAEKPANESSNGNKTSAKEDTVDGEDATAMRQKLNARIVTLQSDISELKEKHAEELVLVRAECVQEVDILKKQLAEVEVNPNVDALKLQIRELEEEVKTQEETFNQDVEVLQQHFQSELKQAFSGDNAGIDMLNRMQELEDELEQVKKSCDCKVKQLEDQHEKEKSEIKEDFATALQVHMGGFSGPFNDEGSNANVEELEQRIVTLQQELQDIEHKYREDLECEKKAHQSEMEETIRDMMMVRNATTTYPDTDAEEGSEDEKKSEKTSTTGAATSDEEIAELRATHQRELEQLQLQHEEEVALIRSDFTLVISSLKQGSSSDTIMDLQSKVNEHDEELEKVKKLHSTEVEDLHGKLKRAESSNFYATRRQEEMGCKIYNMQNELDELEYKHQMEIKSYQDKLGFLTGGSGNEVNEYKTEAIALREKNKLIEAELAEVRNEHEQKTEAIELKLQDEKRKEIGELMDKVWKLESLIDEMKESHLRDLTAFEKTDHNDKLEAQKVEEGRVKELETEKQTLKKEYESEIEDLVKEHKKEVETLRVFYDQQLADMKKKLHDEHGGASHRKVSSDSTNLTNRALKELKEQHEKEINSLKAKCAREKESLERLHQSAIDDIRMQYDEKLKMGYKEGLRRQSTTERKSDGARMRQLISEKDSLNTRLLEQEIKYDNDIQKKDERIKQLEKQLSDLSKNCSGGSGKASAASSGVLAGAAGSGDVVVDSEMEKKLKDNQEQIDRFRRRIDYYHDKAARENTEEYPRVAELQQQILDLQNEMEELTKGANKTLPDEEKKSTKEEKCPETGPTKFLARRGAEQPGRRHTDSVTLKGGRRTERDPRKRWSNLEETTELRMLPEKLVRLHVLKREQNRGSSVLARKTLWENISTDDPKYTG